MPVTYEKYWDDIVAEELPREVPFSYDEILQKLAAARAAYPVLNDQ